MKLLFCDNTIWGLVNFRQAVFRHFYEQGHEIVLVAPDDKHTQMKTDVPDYVRYVPVKLDRTSRNPLEDLRYMARLWRIYGQEKPDCIFHYTIKPNIYGTLAAKLRGITSMAMIAGLGYAFAGHGVTSQVAKLLYRLALSYAAQAFVLNRANYDTLTSLRIVRPERLRLLSSGEGVDTHELPEGEALQPTTPTTFLMVARLLYDKGYAEFVEAARRLRGKGCQADFCLLGPIDESYPNAVTEEQVHKDVEAGIVRYLGFSSRPLETMRRAGVVIVLPSYHEGMSRSLMEACALGRPIITCDIPGCREMVDEGQNGFLVPKKDAVALAEAMEQYLSLDFEARSRMGHESRRLACERFDVSHVIAEYERALAEHVH